MKESSWNSTSKPNSSFLATTAILLLMIISGCTTNPVERYQAHRPFLPLQEDYFMVNIPSFDGTKIRATVYQPNLASDQTAPLVIHSHGFGVWRMTRPTSVYGSLIMSGKAAKAAWKAGYWVISFDQRGFGRSGGDVQLMDPDFEIKDAQAVIDWAVDNLPRITMDSPTGRDPRVAMTGESYGGGMSLLTSMFDERVDAIVPFTTWHDMAKSLAPNQHVKMAWGSILVGVSTTTSLFDTGIFFEKPFISTSLSGKLHPEAKRTMQRRSLSTYCEKGMAPQADTLLIQGFRDTAFPLNDAIHNKRCIEKFGKGADVRLIGVQGGHLLPTQKLTGLMFYNMEKNIKCNNKELNIINSIIAWYDEKLKGQQGAANHIPDTCLTLDNGEGLMLSEIPSGGNTFTVENEEVLSGMSGMFEILMRPVDLLVGLATPGRAANEKDLKRKKGGFMRPAFIPLTLIEKDSPIAGVPKISLKVNAKSEKGVAFVGIGVRKPNHRFIQILSEQLTPLPAKFHYATELPAVSGHLEKDDIVGLVVYGRTGQYVFNSPFIPKTVTLNGTVELPIDATRQLVIDEIPSKQIVSREKRDPVAEL